MIQAVISLGGHTDLHLFPGENLTGVRYRDEIHDANVWSYVAAIGNDFIPMDDNAHLSELLRIILRAQIWSEYNSYFILQTSIRQNMYGTSFADKWLL